MPRPVQSPERSGFAARLRAAREVHCLTQTLLASLVGVSLARYHAWEAGNSTPNRIEIYHAICQHLNVTVDWLFFADTRGISAEMMDQLAYFDLE